MLFGCLLVSLQNIYEVCDRNGFYKAGFYKAFNIKDSGGVCFYLQLVIKSVLVNIQDFTINSSDGVYIGTCFFISMLVSI